MSDFHIHLSILEQCRKYFGYREGDQFRLLFIKLNGVISIWREATVRPLAHGVYATDVRTNIRTSVFVLLCIITLFYTHVDNYNGFRKVLICHE